MICQEINDCRLCRSSNIEVVFKLADTPAPNKFLSPYDMGLDGPIRVQEPKFPLHLYLCKDCGSVGLKHNVDPKYLFDDYLYASSTSESFKKHFKEYSEHLKALLELNDGELVVDIGSNDGIMLRPLQEANLRVIGVEPATNLAKQCQNEGLTVYNDYFTPELAAKIIQEHGHPSVVTCNNCFAHMPDIYTFTQGIRDLLDTYGVFVFENAYLYDTVKNGLFDQVYSEHYMYHSIKPLRKFLRKFKLNIFHVEHNNIQGGTIRVYCEKADGQYVDWPSVDEWVRKEEEYELYNVELYKKWQQEINTHKEKVVGLLKDLKAQGKTICAYGFPAKSTTLLYYYGLDKNTIDFAVDDAPLKQGKLSPGLHIPIISKTEFANRKTDYCVLLAWNFAESIIDNNPGYEGKWVKILPNLEIV